MTALQKNYLFWKKEVKALHTKLEQLTKELDACKKEEAAVYNRLTEEERDEVLNKAADLGLNINNFAK